MSISRMEPESSVRLPLTVRNPSASPLTRIVPRFVSDDETLAKRQFALFEAVRAELEELHADEDDDDSDEK